MKKSIHLIPTDKPSRLAFLHDDNLHIGTNFKKGLNVNTVNVYITSDEEIKEGDWIFANQGAHKVTDILRNHKYPYGTLNYKEDKIYHHKNWNKIILTTDQDLIKDGVQAIDEVFLEWFIKNPSCESVGVELFPKFSNNLYDIIIPKEEPKQDYSGVHFRHCYRGEYEDGCKYGKDDCPAKPLEHKQETIEEVRKVERTELFNSIFSVVKQIPRKDVDGDVMDAPSCASEIEQLFYKWQEEQDRNNEEDLKNAFDSARKFNSLDGVVDVHIVLPMDGDMSDLQPLHFTFDEWYSQFKKEITMKENIEEAAREFDKSKCKHFRREHTKEAVYDSFEEGFTAGAKSDAAREMWHKKFKHESINALKAIENLCDSQNPTHEDIWRIAYGVINDLTGKE